MLQKHKDELVRADVTKSAEKKNSHMYFYPIKEKTPKAALSNNFILPIPHLDL